MELFSCNNPSSCYKFIPLLILFFFISGIQTTRLNPLQEINTNFIKSSCVVTLYPKLCIVSLSTYATIIKNSPKLLVNASLSVTLSRAKATSSIISVLSKSNQLKPREASAVSDCIETMADSVDELQESLGEMAHLGRVGGAEYELQISNIKTWVSAALTNEDTCMEGFEENGINGNIKNIIRSNIVFVAQLTSNALALINSLATQTRLP